MENELIERFETTLLSTGREGVDRLVDFIRKSDFYTAPASTRYHNCHEGGLLEHSLNVYDCLTKKVDNPTWHQYLITVDPESRKIVPLLHDLCKSYMYITEYKNKKVYSESGKKSDEVGRFDWVSVPGYTTDDRIPYGHGEKSVMMIEEYMKLLPVERYAIRWHMGFTEPKENYNALSTAMRKYPLILAMHEADLEATYMLEKEE